MLYQLEFPSLKEMNAFLKTLGTTYTEINHRTLTIICECSEIDVEKAKAAGAKVIKANV